MNTDRMVITGAAGGAGARLVERFLANDDTVLATDIGSDALERLQGTFSDDAKLITAAADISNEEDCEGLADLVRERAGRVDVLINCAGFFPFAPFEEISSNDWKRVIDINLTGSFLTTQAFLPLMKDREWDPIINFGSGFVFDGTRGQAHYVAAKAGIVGFSRSLAREVGGYGITVNVVAPGLTVTKAVRESFPPAILESPGRPSTSTAGSS